LLREKKLAALLRRLLSVVGFTAASPKCEGRSATKGQKK
jgi:hypothetical protein